MVISIMVGTLGAIPKQFGEGIGNMEIRGQGETMQTTALGRSSRILRRILETLGDLHSLKLPREAIR